MEDAVKGTWKALRQRSRPGKGEESIPHLLLLAYSTGLTAKMLHDRLTAYLKRMTTLAMLIADALEQDKIQLYEDFEKVKAESFEILDMRRGCVYWGPGNIELLSWLRCAGDTAMAMQLQEYMVRYINSKKGQTKPLSLDPNLKMVHDIFMHAYFVIQDSTIKGAGMGLFLQRGITLKCPFLLPAIHRVCGIWEFDTRRNRIYGEFDT